MTNPEDFADPVIVPGPNLRSRSVDTEEVGDAAAAQLDEVEPRWCPTCDRVSTDAALVCPTDGTGLIALPGASTPTP